MFRLRDIDSLASEAFSHTRARVRVRVVRDTRACVSLSSPIPVTLGSSHWITIIISCYPRGSLPLYTVSLPCRKRCCLPARGISALLCERLGDARLIDRPTRRLSLALGWVDKIVPPTRRERLIGQCYLLRMRTCLSVGNRWLHRVVRKSESSMVFSIWLRDILVLTVRSNPGAPTRKQTPRWRVFSSSICCWGRWSSPRTSAPKEISKVFGLLWGLGLERVVDKLLLCFLSTTFNAFGIYLLKR